MNHKPSLSEGASLDFTNFSKNVDLKNTLHPYQSSWMQLMSSKGTKKKNLLSYLIFKDAGGNNAMETMTEH